MSLDLYIGNKNYSSWSLRPWLLLSLTYDAITQATHEAFITYSNMSELVGRLVV